MKSSSHPPIAFIKRSPGRPPRSGEPATNRTLRVTEAEWDAWERAATAKGKTISDWLRELANRAAKR